MLRSEAETGKKIGGDQVRQTAKRYLGLKSAVEVVVNTKTDNKWVEGRGREGK
jgi:hypothetical protein